MSWFSLRRKQKVVAIPTDPIIPPSDDLWDLVLDMDWERVMDHAEQNPNDAKYLDGHWHETPLYLACQFHPPANVIRAIVKAYPQAVSIPSRENHDLPLHLACRYQAPVAVLEALVKDFPVTAVEQTRWGKTALTVLWEFQQPSPLTQEFWGKVSILLNAVARFREDPRYVCQTPQTRTKEFRSIGGEYCHETTESTTTTTINDETNYSLVHAAVSLGARCCPVPVLEHMMAEYPDAAFQQDAWGQLPLHIVIGPTSWSNATKRKYKPREQPFIERLLRANPAAAKERLFGDERGRYPLHMALANRHCWSGGVSELFNAAPDALLIADPISGLYPFQLAAVPVGETTVDLDTIYHLLRSQPTVLVFFDLEKKHKARATTIEQGEKKEVSNATTTAPSKLSLGLPEAVLGTATAVLIGMVAGVVPTD